jgi:uncharacterized protein YlxW (UPF0749 family)
MIEAWLRYLAKWCPRTDAAIINLTERIDIMSQEIVDLQAAVTAEQDATQKATAAIASLLAKVTDLQNQVATLTAQATDAAQIPPITTAIQNDTAALNAAVATVPAS